MKENLSVNEENQTGENRSADLNPRSQTLQGKVSKVYSFKVKPLKPKQAEQYFQAAVSKLVDEDKIDSLSDEEWLLLFESTEILRKEKNVQFIDKNYKKCEFLWFLFVIEQTAPFRSKVFVENNKQFSQQWSDYVLSIKDRNSILGRLSLSDLLIIENRLIKRKLLEPTFIGKGYKDKGSLTNSAEDGSPSWQEITSSWIEDLENMDQDSIWRKSDSNEVFEWSIKGIKDLVTKVM